MVIPKVTKLVRDIIGKAKLDKKDVKASIILLSSH